MARSVVVSKPSLPSSSRVPLVSRTGSSASKLMVAPRTSQLTTPSSEGPHRWSMVAQEGDGMGDGYGSLGMLFYFCVPGREGRKAVDLVTVTPWLAVPSYECRSVTSSDASVTSVNIEVGGVLPARILDSPSTCWANGRETARALVVSEPSRPLTAVIGTRAAEVDRGDGLDPRPDRRAGRVVGRPPVCAPGRSRHHQLTGKHRAP